MNQMVQVSRHIQSEPNTETVNRLAQMSRHI